MTRREVYSKLYNTANAIIRENNPCKFETKDGKTTCAANRAESPYASVSGVNGCCSNCPSLDPTKGCMIDSLDCKLWTCGYLRAQESAQVTLISLQMLRTAANRAEMPSSIWTSREMAFQRAGE